jgi:hypothetical protein
MKAPLVFERHRYLLVDPPTKTEAHETWRFHLEDDIDRSGFFTLSEEQVESTDPKAKVLEIEHAIDFDIPLGRWLVEQVLEMRAGKRQDRPRMYVCPAEVKPPTRFRVQEEPADGLFIITHELTAGRGLWTTTMSTPARMVLGRATVDWFAKELGEILSLRGYAPLTQFHTPINIATPGNGWS